MRHLTILTLGLSFLASTALAPAALASSGPDRSSDRVPVASADQHAQGYGRVDTRDRDTGDDEDDSDEEGDNGRSAGIDRDRLERAMPRADMIREAIGRAMRRHMLLRAERPAAFVLRGAHGSVLVRCGAHESTHTCIDAIMPLLDRAQSLAASAGPSAAPPASTR